MSTGRRRALAWFVLIPLVGAAAACAGDDSTTSTAASSPPTATEPTLTALDDAPVDSPAPTVTPPASSVAPTTAATTVPPAAPACAGDPGVLNRHESFAYDGADREYLAATPATYTPGRRLLLDLHGWSGNARDLDDLNGLAAAGTAAGLVVLTPQSLGDPTEWNFGRNPAAADDYGFLDALIADALDRYCVDTGEVILVGTSNGAAMAGLYACTDARVTAVVMVIATVPDTCPERPQRPSVLSIRGAADPIVAYDGVDDLMATWAATSGCAAEPVVSEPWAGIIRTEHPGCAAGRVVLDTVVGGSHAWPAGPTDATDPGHYAATLEILAFVGAAEAAGPTDVAEPALRDELLAMMAEDQAEMLGESPTDNYRARTDRLAEILDRHGWPGFDLVGHDGSESAWVIAQHADLDPVIQQRALELLREAVDQGQASHGDLAYLHDRVAVAAGEPQLYGTQIRCGDDATPVPATPITDEANVDTRRAEAGLPPLADYVAEMAAICGGE